MTIGNVLYILKDTIYIYAVWGLLQSNIIIKNDIILHWEVFTKKYIKGLNGPYIVKKQNKYRI